MAGWSLLCLTSARDSFWREIADALHGLGIERLQHSYQQLHHLIKVTTVDDPIVRVRVAHRYHHVDRGNTAIALLDFGGVVAVTYYQGQLQRHLFGGCGDLYELHEFAIGKLG